MLGFINMPPRRFGHFKQPSFSRGVAFGIKHVAATRLELQDAEGLCTTADILEVADSLIAHYTNAEADITD